MIEQELARWYGRLPRPDFDMFLRATQFYQKRTLQRLLDRLVREVQTTNTKAAQGGDDVHMALARISGLTDAANHVRKMMEDLAE
jgi:hypothetical protein